MDDQNEIKPGAYIFDIDGVLADNSPRQHLLQQEGKTKKACWQEFYDASGEDPVYPDTLELLKTLQASGNKILLVTGRSEEYHHLLIPWLEKHGIKPDGLYARKRYDFRQDWEVKSEIYQTHIRPYYRVLGVFEDRYECVKMWRSFGLTCYQPRESTY